MSKVDFFSKSIYSIYLFMLGATIFFTIDSFYIMRETRISHSIDFYLPMNLEKLFCILPQSRFISLLSATLVIITHYFSFVKKNHVDMSWTLFSQFLLSFFVWSASCIANKYLKLMIEDMPLTATDIVGQIVFILILIVFCRIYYNHNGTEKKSPSDNNPLEVEGK